MYRSSFGNGCQVQLNDDWHCKQNVVYTYIDILHNLYITNRYDSTMY